MLRTEYIDIDFNLKLQKDLQEHEVICSHCGGTGLQVDDNPFGLREEGERPNYGNLFPYKQQVIRGCNYCYNGVQKKCLHCEKVLERQKYQCDCEKSKQERIQERHDKDLEIWNKSKKMSLEDALKDYIMVYIENYDKYLMIDELEDWLVDKEFDIEESIDRKSLMIYGTQSLDLSMDASNVIEDACSDLHEDAMDNISVQEEEKLQALLDKWCEENSAGTTSYYVDFNVGIIL